MLLPCAAGLRIETNSSCVTARLRAVTIEGADVFEETDIGLVFHPYQTEAVTVIPVKGEKYNERFLVELYNLKGAVAGDDMSAFVIVSIGRVSKEQSEHRVNDVCLGIPVMRMPVPSQVSSASDTTRYFGQDIQIIESPASGKFLSSRRPQGLQHKAADMKKIAMCLK